MGDVYNATLILQDIARELSEDRAAGLASDPGHVASLSAWTEKRLLLSSVVPADDVDALASCHSLSQLANALIECREQPEAQQTLAIALLAGLEALATRFETMTGKTREELGLFADYMPPGGLN